MTTPFETFHGRRGEYVECPDCGATLYVPSWDSIVSVMVAHDWDGCEGKP